jgi:hypothetical protein
MDSTLLHIQVVIGSNMDPEFSYPDEGFVVFLNPSRQMPR